MPQPIGYRPLSEEEEELIVKAAEFLGQSPGAMSRSVVVQFCQALVRQIGDLDEAIAENRRLQQQIDDRRSQYLPVAAAVAAANANGHDQADSSAAGNPGSTRTERPRGK